MSPLSLSRHLLGRALSLFPFLRYFLLLSFLPLPPPPPMENPKEDPNLNPDSPLAAEEEEREEEEGEVVVVEEEGEEEEEEGEEEEEEEEEEESDSASESAPRARPSRTPFTSLSQVDADLALARTLQEQERAYMMLRMSGGGGVGSGFAGSETGSEYEVHYEDGDDEDHLDGDHGTMDGESDYDDDAFDAQDPTGGIDPSTFNDDEAYARALQDAEEREVAVRLMALAGINDWGGEDREDHGSNSQDTWLEVDPDELSYEELVALGEAVGTESRGLSADTIASLPSVIYKAQSAQEGTDDQCVVCRLDFEDGDSLTMLSCKHTYHSDCINKWLQINKVCPVCSAEVSTSENRQG